MRTKDMAIQEVFIIEDGVEVPESALRTVEEDAFYGSVPGLSDDEFAGFAELEWQAFVADWGPILDLPWQGSDSGIRPVVDEFGQLDWGAFGTVDFARLRPPFDKARYKADKLQETLEWALLMFSTVQERLSLQARLEVLARIGSGVDLDAFQDANEYAYARWYLRARNLRNEIRELRALSRRRRLNRTAGTM